MKLTITKPQEIDAKYLKIIAHVRYWEDSEINGESDNDIFENDELSPTMPFAVKENDEWVWKPIIDIEEQKVVDWPEGVTADIHYKVCDEGTYQILDENMNVLVSVDSYVPECIGEWGDYIVMHINEDGTIDDFTFEQDDLDNMISGAF